MDKQPVDRFNRRDPLYAAILLSDTLSGVHPLLASPVLVGLAAVAAWPWGHAPLRFAAGILTLAFMVIDGASLALLPYLQRSFGPVTPPLLALGLLRTALTFVLGALAPARTTLDVVSALQLALVVIQVYATWIEPFRLRITQLELHTTRLDPNPALRLLHLSDVHFEGWSPRERELEARVRELAPDMILMTGDYLNLSSVEDPRAQAGVRDLLASIAAYAPTYAITGSPPVDLPHVVPAIMDGLPITWLIDEVAEVTGHGQRIRLVGVRCTRDRHVDGARLATLLPAGAGDVFTILLYHSPDLMPHAVELGVDLYLAGHTHGGQLRLPLFGAIVTSSAFGKRYEAGRYSEGRTTLYVNRGLGVEGMGAPRARFLAPPEIALWSIKSEVK